MARYRDRDDGLMIDLQVAPDERPMAEKFLSRDDLHELGERDDEAWAAIWEPRGYTPQQCRQLRGAFADLESAWLVFWEGRDADGALWRLVDAAGQLAEVFPPDRFKATGRGYRIEKVASWSSNGHRWGGEKPSSAVPTAPRLQRLRSVDPPPLVRPKPVALDPRRAFSRLQKAEIFLRANGHCCGCGCELGDDWHADHFIPHAWGGLTEVRNGIALCIPCNQRKRDNILTAEEREE